MKILVGADPELFVKKNGSFVSGHGLINGDKHHPLPVTDGAVQVDGLALEFNTNPVDNEKDFVFNINSVLRQLAEMVPEYDLIIEPVADFTPEYMSGLPPKALELGCSPDYNAWTSKENVKPNCNLPMRTAAGHVHVGWTENTDITDVNHVSMCEALVRQLDFVLGLPSLMYDSNVRRREMYGAAGAYRPKTYGVEYRVLSNCWLKSDELIGWVFRNTKRAVDMLVSGRDLHEEYGDIQQVINQSDTHTASLLIKDIGLEVPNVR